MSFGNCEQFTISYDRHKGLYGYRVRNFPAEYEENASMLDWLNDPYARDKFKEKKVNLKGFFAFLVVAFLVVRFREEQVSEYDRLKRFEQRAMQNKEADEAGGKRARFVLFDKDGNQFTEQSLASTPTSYTLIWIDQKLKNYELCVNYFLTKQRITHATIQPILVVDKPSTMSKIQSLWLDDKQKVQVGPSLTNTSRSDEKSKLYKVLLKRPLSKDEQLARDLM